MKRGVALIELMVTMGIIAIMLPALITAFFSARGGSVQSGLRFEAIALAGEAREALRVVREAGWVNVATNGIYHPVVSGSTWSLTANQETLGGITRQVEIRDAYRDGSGNLTTVAGTTDPSVKRVLITTSWGSFLPSRVISDYYLMRFENLTWVQTTLAQFNTGTLTGTTTTNTAGGEITLASGGVALADWCAPNLSLAQVNLPKSGVANAISAKVGASSGQPNQIIAGTGNNSSGESMAYATASDTNPPTLVANPADTFDGYKTNGVYVASNYAYITTDKNSAEVVIVSLTQRDSNGKYLEAGVYNAQGNGTGVAVAVVGTVGYVTIGNTLRTFNVTNPASVSTLGSVTLSGNGEKFVVNGSYVYVSESSGARPLEIVRVTNGGTTLSVVGWASISGQNGRDVVVNQTASRAYLATSQGRVYILNTQNPASGALPVPIGSYNTNGMSPRGLTVVTNNKAIVVGTGGTLQYQVIDITNETNPILCTNGGTTSGGISVVTGVNGIASVQEADGDTYSYIITGDSNAELKVIQGGAGGGGGLFTNEGTYESVIFDASRSATFNRFDSTITTPVDTTLTFQVAITSPVSGSCSGASYTFVGPDKTSNTFFGSSAQLPLGMATGYANPGQCFKYRGYLETTNTNSSPTLYDITVNYSP